MFKIYPKKYDPMMANGPPPEYLKKEGISWEKEDTLRCTLLEKECWFSNERPVDYWYEEKI